MDAVGNYTHLQETTAKVGGGTSSYTLPYTLERLYRLTSAGQPTAPPHAYSYVPVGNRLTKTGDPALRYDKADRITSASYQQDSNGNLHDTPTSSYQYDNTNRLTQPFVPNVTESYALDGDDKRATKRAQV